MCGRILGIIVGVGVIGLAVWYAVSGDDESGEDAPIAQADFDQIAVGASEDEVVAAIGAPAEKVLGEQGGGYWSWNGSGGQYYVEFDTDRRVLGKVYVPTGAHIELDLCPECKNLNSRRHHRYPYCYRCKNHGRVWTVVGGTPPPTTDPGKTGGGWNDRCPKCNNSGTETCLICSGQGRRDCDTCRGTGKVLSGSPFNNTREERDCGVCVVGKVKCFGCTDGKRTCTTCGGTSR